MRNISKIGDIVWCDGYYIVLSNMINDRGAMIQYQFEAKIRFCGQVDPGFDKIISSINDKQ